MNKASATPPPRRVLAFVGTVGTTQLHLRSPIITALWSILFPGFGHILLAKYLRGFLLFIWEVFINYKAKINLLILFSFIGDFEKAKSVVDIRWMMLYIPTYLFAAWDSYRSAVDMNFNYILAAREDAEFQPSKVNTLEINYLDKRKPWMAAAWSALMPGTGQLYVHRIITALFIVCWWIIVSYYSGVLPAMHYTLYGEFSQAKAALDMHWFLNFPSLYFFTLYEAYVNAVENNKLYDREQAKFLRRHYQSPSFRLPPKKEADNVYIISTFEHTKYLELAITAIEMKGIKKSSILAVPLDKRREDITLFDTIHGSDGLSMLDVPIILATFLGIFGSIYGYILTWGPLLWGLIGIIAGIALGLVIKLLTTRRFNNRQKGSANTEVVLIVECTDKQLDMVKETLWAHHAFGVSRLDLDSNAE